MSSIRAAGTFAFQKAQEAYQEVKQFATDVVNQDLGKPSVATLGRLKNAFNFKAEANDPLDRKLALAFTSTLAIGVISSILAGVGAGTGFGDITQITAIASLATMLVAGGVLVCRKTETSPSEDATEELLENLSTLVLNNPIYVRQNNAGEEEFLFGKTEK